MDFNWIYDDHLHKVVSKPQVNFGHCYVWAWVVAAHYPKAELWTDVHKDEGLPEGIRAGCHAFIKYGDRFYDSDSPFGLTRPKSLRCYQVNCAWVKEEDIIHVEPSTLYSVWNFYGSFEHKLQTLLKEHNEDSDFFNTVVTYNMKHGVVLPMTRHLVKAA